MLKREMPTEMFLLLTQIFSHFALTDIKDNFHPKRSLTTRIAPAPHVLNATENIGLKCRDDRSLSESFDLSLCGIKYIFGMHLFCSYKMEF